MLAGLYEFRATKDGYGTTISSVYVNGGQTNSMTISLVKETRIDSPISGVTLIVGFAVFILLSVLLLRKVRRGDMYDEGIPTQSYESASQSEVLPEVSQESNEPVLYSGYCRRCGATFVRSDASYCWNCGADLTRQPKTITAQSGKRKSSATIGRCMVCNLDVKENEVVLWCPYCGNMGHRTHVLEWLHTRNYCPECHSHLDESDLRPQ
jgi:uncharacterized paraquat-inducible protein A